MSTSHIILKNIFVILQNHSAFEELKQWTILIKTKHESQFNKIYLNIDLQCLVILLFGHVTDTHLKIGYTKISSTGTLSSNELQWLDKRIPGYQSKQWSPGASFTNMV